MFSGILKKYRRRPFPPNLEALRHCRVSYSQFGEDLYLTMLLGYEKSNGTYVDIGCFHPIQFSNTYIFYQRGWHGIAVDPNPELRKLWARYRPRDLFLSSAISNSTVPVRYNLNKKYPACSRLISDDNPTAATLSESVSQIKPVRLVELLGRHLPEGCIDLLNIDCEGHDLDVIKSNDFSRWKPNIIAIEETTVQPEMPIAQYLARFGYECSAQIGKTKVFTSS
jgi:FkbM family methyltransferase